ncbi:Na/Pi cotransporter family protein [Alkaliphilus hydrothermalis]|uniref:Phosphate:Na+ symporter n=1 Tax=Alkaliphilus hydrothermalis TaxID=1482730 RepID=A0ABS2NSH3_9FIRM|nr:Na/Pi symporter [Alkaliphilus hydrothermalis]MBM7615907.1 phosphate:Na+ symporter [Alkaliphilus hydrothermalis]
MFTIVLGVACGLGIFLIGMRFLTNGLKSLTSGRLKHKIQNAKIHPIIGLLIGTFVTMLIQSSSGTTVLLVGLVEAGLLTLPQVVPMIMGANIGTTITAQLIAFQIGQFAPLLLITGVLLSMTEGKRKLRLLGEVMTGLSLIFIGMNILGNGLAPLQEYMRFQEILAELGDTPIFGVLMGFCVTAIIQSSSTGIAILQSLAYNHTLNIFSAVPILFGQNIGTCVTTIIASANLSSVAKRTACIHLLFNLLGVILLFPFISYLCRFALLLAPYNPARQIAHAHSLFNVIITLLILPFRSLLVTAANLMIKD